MVCLDTSFVVDLLRGKKEVEKIKNTLDKSSDSIVITSPTVMEIIKGLRIGKPSKNEGKKIEEFISSIPVLSFDKKSAILAGEIESDLIKKGKLIDIEDIMIAAISIINKERLITRNRKHFRRIKDLEIEGY